MGGSLFRILIFPYNSLHKKKMIPKVLILRKKIQLLAHPIYAPIRPGILMLPTLFTKELMDVRLGILLPKPFEDGNFTFIKNRKNVWTIIAKNGIN